MNEALTFYAFWNGEQVATLLHAIVGLTSSSLFTLLAMTFTLLGFLVLTTGASITYRPVEILFFGAALVVMMGVLTPKVTIAVEDTRTHRVEVVANVPLGLGWPAARLSEVSYQLTRLFETAFNYVDAAQFSQYGVVFPQKAINTLLAVGPVSVALREDLNQFLSHCVVPEIVENRAKREEVMTSVSLWSTIKTSGWVNPARRVVVAGDLVSCPQALTNIESVMSTTELPKIERLLGTQLNLPEVATGSLDAAVRRVLPGAEALMLGAARDLTESLKQSVLMTTLPRAVDDFALRNHSPMTVAVALSRSQGNMAAEINYRTMGEMAAQMLPKVRNLLEFIILAAFPLVFLVMLMLGHKSGTILRSYLAMLFSICLWGPLMAAVNYLIVHTDANTMNRLVEATGGVTLASLAAIREAGATSQSMAGYLMLLVPLLAYAIARGSEMGVATLTNSLMGPASSAAQSLGNSLAMGNVNAGNTSLGNATLNNDNRNKTDQSSYFAGPTTHTTSNAYGNAVFDTSTAQSASGSGVPPSATAGGSAYGGASYQAGSSATVTSMNVRQSDVGVSLATGASRSFGYSDNWNSSLATSVTTSTGSMSTAGINQQYETGTSVNNAERSAQAMSSQTTTSAATQTSVSNQLSTSQGAGMRSEGVATDQLSSQGYVAVNGVLRKGLGEIDIPYSKDVNTTNNSDISSGSLATGSFGTMPKTGLVGSNVAKQSGTTNITDTNNELLGFSGSLKLATNISGSISESSTTYNDSQNRQSTSENQSETSQESNQNSQTRELASQKASNSGRMDRLNSSQQYQDGERVDKAQTGVRSQGDSSSTQDNEVVSVNNSPVTMQMAMQLANGSVTDALRAFNQGQAPRKALSNQMKENFMLPESLGARGIDEQRAILDRAATMRQSQHQIQQSIEEKSNVLPNVQATTVPEDTGHRQIGTLNRQSIEEQALQLGLNKATNAFFTSEETGMKSVISRTLGFGLNYTSPTDFKHTLQEKAMSNPELKSYLSELGKDQNANPSSILNKLKGL